MNAPGPIRLLVVCAALAIGLAWGGRAVAAAPPKGGEAAVVAWLRHRLGPPGAGPSGVDDTRYSLGWADLNGDGRPEAFAYVSGRDWCGTGGCNLYVLELARGRVRPVASLTITRPPIALLPTRTHGWRDFAVKTCDSGVCYPARLRFDGRRYPGNPSIVPRVKGHPREAVVIGDHARGKPLFPAGAAARQPGSRPSPG